MNKNLLLNINSYLLILFPFFLVTGPLLPEITLILTTIIFLVLSFEEKDFKYFNNKIFKIFLIFYLLINISTILNPTFMSFKSSLFYFRFGFLSLVIWHVIDKNPKFLKYFFISISILCVTIFLDSIIQIFFKRNIFNFPLSLTGRVSSFFGEELVLGSFLSKIFPLYIALVFLLKIKKKKYILPILASLFLINIFIASSRTSLGTFVLFLVLFIIFLKNYKLILSFLTILLILISLTYMYNKTGFNRLFVHTLNQFSENNTMQIHSFRHTLHYLTAWNMFKYKPIFGHGPKSFRLNCFKSNFVPKKYIQVNNTYKTEQEIELKILINTTYSFNDQEFGREFNNNDFINSLEVVSKLSIFGDHIFGYKSEEKDQEYIYKLPENFLLFDAFKFSKLKNTATASVTLYTKNINTNEEKIIIKDKPNAKFYINKDSIQRHSDKIIISKNSTYFVNVGDYSNGCNTHPHSFYLQLLSETGIIGFIFVSLFYLFAIFLLFLNLFKFKINYLNFNKLPSSSIIILIGYISVLFPLFPSGNFFNNWLSMLIYLPSGFILSQIYKK